ncbi:plasma membrane iron permease [Aaosphaeria arxii CBS 175.79]|uniref:Plasma membrane iron permease n=1 Tax=Aaosphaeria arxii CBS 175.79 TaxID=1450172 RepID=A0A6A5X7R4_9PLEO|nr:plasma membrane iron permease [Aaosphaeria arxii CBS 175.79]KAF2008998.1 plasma membrane iron permease [Aaosphaeria arxii CBS 175.79]
MVDLFAVPVFFICFRECLETSIIVSVLLAFLKQTLADHDPAVRKKLVRQIWWGVALGLLICIFIGAGCVAAFYVAGELIYDKFEHLWEGVFSLVAAVIITIVGGALLRVNKLQDKWRVKIAKIIEARESELPSEGRFKRWAEKYAMFILPFVTVLREGIEAVVFIAGVGVGLPATAYPLAVIAGFGGGAFVGYLIYKGGNQTSLQKFLIVSTCFLYLVAAGLFSKGVWNFEEQAWVNLAGEDAAEAGSGPGSYDVRNVVWHVNCCSPLEHGDGIWGIFNSILGWQNTATYGSIISYNLYWLVVIAGFLLTGFKEKHGRWPLCKEPAKVNSEDGENSGVYEPLLAASDRRDVSI